LPQGEPFVQVAEYRNWPYQSGCPQVAASREVLLGKRTYRNHRLHPVGSSKWDCIVNGVGYKSVGECDVCDSRE